MLLSTSTVVPVSEMSPSLVQFWPSYETHQAPSSILKERYRAQLYLYELAVRKAYGAIAVEKYIFVLGRNELISL